MRFLAICFLALLAILDGHAQGIIWSANSQAGGSVAPGQSWQVFFEHIPDPFSGQNPATSIFSMSLFTNDTGRTFFADASNEPGFAGFAASLTDGINGYIHF